MESLPLRISLDEHQCLSFEGEQNHIHIFLTTGQIKDLFNAVSDFISEDPSVEFGDY